MPALNCRRSALPVAVLLGLLGTTMRPVPAQNKIAPSPRAVSSTLLASSDFHDGPQGWTAVRAGTGETREITTLTGQAEVGVFYWVKSPHSAILGWVQTPADTGWYWRAPASFRGNLSAAYGGTLNFGWVTDGDQTAPNTVLLTGASMVLAHPVQNRSTNGAPFLNEQFTLDERSGWVRADTGAAATEVEMRAVLAAVTDLEIPASWSSSTRQNWGDGLQFVEIHSFASGKAKVNHTALKFGKVQVGKSKQIQITISNTSRTANDTLHVRLGSLTAPFSVPQQGTTVDVPPKSALKLSIRFTPTEAAAAVGDFTVSTSDPAHPTVVVHLTGTGRH